ncbi:MAG: hypothetical protein J1F31_01100 [Erysipelotrichales bacterium]|nr:hypothetical protein [Erysipelotrichales bacterium]
MIAYTIEKLIKYAKFHLNLSELDEIYIRNTLLNKLKVSSCYKDIVDDEEIKNMVVPDSLISELIDYIKSENIVEENCIDQFITEIMGVITPMPSEVVRQFNSFEDKQQAFNYLYNLQIKNNYIQKTAVDKNILWVADFGDKYLEISINLSKPEKKNSDIAKLISAPKIENEKYPKCLLCKENLGFSGNASHPARNNLRTIPTVLDDKPWFIQYSPYVYYDQHCIVIDSEHKNMTMGKEKFKKLLDFVDNFPCYFIGSNSELPIVGGSILNHEHFQGGKHLLPITKAKNELEFECEKYDKCKLSYLNFFNSTLKIESTDKVQILNLMDAIYETWKMYDDADIDIISHEGNTQHNTVTPIVRKVDKTYIAYLVLRNNRVSDIYKEGIFHAHKEYHNIKSEGIGLIEASGLYILPARLKRQLGEIENMLCGEYDIETFINENVDYEIHRQFIYNLINQYGRNNTSKEAHDIVISEVNKICANILENTAVFKHTEVGKEHLIKFVNTIKK